MATSQRRRVLWLVLLGLGAFVLVQVGTWALRAYGIKAYKIPSGAMEPTILIGDHVYVDKMTFRQRDPRRGELAVFRFPEDPSREFISRVIAVPGDRIEIRDKKLYLNGQPQEEPNVVHIDPFIIPESPFPRMRQRDNFKPYTLPREQYFVMGDNRDNSNDSRFFGPVDRSLFTGGPGMWVYWSYDPETKQARWDRVGKSMR